MSTIVYGLKNCDKCRKARNWLDRFGIEYRFVDYRADPVTKAQLADWAEQLAGFEQLVNKASTTWRNLVPQRKTPASDAEWLLLLLEYPALIKRPAVQVDGEIELGFTNNAFKQRFGQ